MASYPIQTHQKHRDLPTITLPVPRLRQAMVHQLGQDQLGPAPIRTSSQVTMQLI